VAAQPCGNSAPSPAALLPAVRACAAAPAAALRVMAARAAVVLLPPGGSGGELQRLLAALPGPGPIQHHNAVGRPVSEGGADSPAAVTSMRKAEVEMSGTLSHLGEKGFEPVVPRCDMRAMAVSASCGGVSQFYAVLHTRQHCAGTNLPLTEMHWNSPMRKQYHAPPLFLRIRRCTGSCCRRGRYWRRSRRGRRRTVMRCSPPLRLPSGAATTEELLNFVEPPEAT